MQRLKIHVAIVAGLLALAGCSSSSTPDTANKDKDKPASTDAAASTAGGFANEKEKYSYMVGLDISRSLGSIKDEIDVSVVEKALDDGLSGKTTRMTQEEALKVRQEFMQKLQAKQASKSKEESEKNQKEGDEFLAKNKDKPGVKVTASGLQYEVVKEGTGEHPKPTDTVKVDYTGTKIDGTKFDSSIDRGQPATFPLNGVIPGWTEGLQLMTPGSEYKFYIPAALAYKDHGPPNIGQNATLIFDVKLLSIEPPAAAPAAVNKPGTQTPAAKPVKPEAKPTPKPVSK
jgi:FKBP-type peptidyl-prolyl cis-trans isomerase FkpA